MYISADTKLGASPWIPSQAKSFVVLDEDVLKVVPAKEQVKVGRTGATSWGCHADSIFMGTKRDDKPLEAGASPFSDNQP